MSETTKPKSAKKRVKVQDLMAAETKSTKKEMKKVKGGAYSTLKYGVNASGGKKTEQ
jgi:hypothetical protein